MRKVILAFDGNHFTTSVLKLICALNEESPIYLLAIFISESELNYYSDSSGSVKSRQLADVMVDRKFMVRNIALLEKWCTENNIHYKISNRNSKGGFFEVEQESKYADLLVVGSEIFHQQADSEIHIEHLKTLLNDIACPVLLVPENSEYPTRSIFTYDGSDDSLYAISQFSYLFPELGNNDSLLIYSSDANDKSVPDKNKIEDWMGEQKSIIIVTGTYNKSSFIDKLHTNLIDDLLSDFHFPIFLAHR